jgi:hypothetical protein
VGPQRPSRSITRLKSDRPLTCWSFAFLCISSSSAFRLSIEAKSVGVVIAEGAAITDEGVLVEGAGLLVLAERVQVAGEVVG